MKRVSPSLFALLILMQAGCSSSVLQLRERLHLHHGELHQKIVGENELEISVLLVPGKPTTNY